MITASELAGHIAAHAIWCVSESDGLIPMLGFATQDGQRNLERLVFPDAGDAVEYGRRRLNDNPFTARDGVLAHSGRTIHDGIEHDAILLELRHYGLPQARATIAVPYRPRNSGLFRVHLPNLVAWEQCGDCDKHAAFRAFFQGVYSHEEAAQVWAAALDGRNARLTAIASGCSENLPPFDRSRGQELLKEKPASPLTADQIGRKAHRRSDLGEHSEAALLFCLACERAAEEFASGRQSVDQSPNHFVRAALNFNKAGCPHIAEPMLHKVIEFEWNAYGLPGDSHMTECAFAELVLNQRNGSREAFLSLFDEAEARCRELGWAFPRIHPYQEALLTAALGLDEVRLVQYLIQRISARQPISREAKALLRKANSLLSERRPATENPQRRQRGKKRGV